jgi:hypothetical protein
MTTEAVLKFFATIQVGILVACVIVHYVAPSAIG